MLRNASRSFLLVGLALVVLGVISIAVPGVTLSLVAAVFAVVAFVVAAREVERAFSSENAGPAAGHLLLGVADVAAGIGTLVWPGLTVLVLSIWIGAWALVTGAGEFGLAFQAGETAGERARFGLGGLMAMVLGVSLFAWPGIGAVALAEVFGVFALVYGCWSIALAVTTYSTDKRIGRVLHPGA